MSIPGLTLSQNRSPLASSQPRPPRGNFLGSRPQNLVVSFLSVKDQLPSCFAIYERKCRDINPESKSSTRRFGGSDI